ncbi:MAG: hypothetical protein U9N49_01750 [Campylobacterota bacterium]|nr:hypothetical protein [Campylobacterota bacterium]
MKKMIKFLKIGFIIFLTYSFLMFFYLASLDTPLGQNFKWTCFEPGCIIINDEIPNIGVYGDIEELSVTNQYIFGKVAKPNQWMQENENNYSIEGYFILDKFNYQKDLAMTKEKFQKKCKKLKIGNCKLKYAAPIHVIYDPFYLWMLFKDKLK